MRLKSLGVVLAAALFVAGITFAQTSQSSSGSMNDQSADQNASQTNPNAPEGAAGNVVIGKVTSYTPNQSITIKTQNGQTRTFNLSGPNMTANVDPSVKVGSRVKVAETNANGQMTINVQPYQATRGARAGRTLPKTASDVPLFGLLGLLSLMAAAGIRIASKQNA